jgi:superfamily I DNA/RNA helicase
MIRQQNNNIFNKEFFPPISNPQEKNYGLNAEQYSAILSSPVTYINASAGSGKTRCLIAKIRLLLDSGTKPENICAITFTNKAAKEILDRLSKYTDVSAMQISTIHSMCVKIIKKFLHHTYLKSPFSIYDDSDSESIIRTVIKAMKKDELTVEECSKFISKFKEEGINALQEFNGNEQIFMEILNRYQKILQKNNACDFDDLLVLALNCLKQDDCRYYFTHLWTSILVDEFQDTSTCQYDIIKLLYDPTITKDIFVVGDLNQCVTEQTVIETENGIKQFKDFNEKDCMIRCATGSGKSGMGNITGRYQKFVEDFPVITVTTKEGFTLTSSYNHIYFAGFNKLSMTKSFYVYLIYKKDLGYRIGLTGGMFNDFTVILNQNLGDALWILGVFKKEKEAKYHEYFYSIKYGIPTWAFQISYRNLNTGYDDESIKKLFLNIDTRKNAQKLFDNLFLSTEFPHYISQAKKINKIESGKLTEFSLAKIPASNLIIGMSCFIYKNNTIEMDTIVSLNKDLYTGFLYDIDVNHSHNFIGNGIVTHNSIYGWRSAKPENVQKYIKEFGAQTHWLTYNYRSSPEICTHASKFLQFGPPMVPKIVSPGKVSITVFESFEDEARKITANIFQKGKEYYSETAIIYRMNSRSLFFERELTKANIPHKVVNSLPFYQHKVIKDLLAALKASNNMEDRESLARIINRPKRGFGDAKKEQLLLHGQDYIKEIRKDLPHIDNFLHILEDIKGKRPADAITEYLNRTKYLEIVETDDDRSLIDSLRNIILEYNNVEELLLASTFLEKEKKNGVTLTTAHGAKGLEWKRTFVTSLDCWPHPNSLDILEENRLYYMAITRAHDFVNISYSKTRPYRGTIIECYPSNLFKKSYKEIYGRDYN